jgi:hypothetical protein
MEMKSINRNVLVIRPKQAMLDWVNALEPNLEDVVQDFEGHDESNIYLIKEMDVIEDNLKWLRKNFKDIFEEELFNWWTDESAWPPMTWESFEAFCHYRIHTCVYDTQRGGIQYE